MELDFKETPTSESFPQALEDFMKNNPNMKHENLYLCESVDMNGNIVDTKIGVNLLTNYGLSDHFASGNNRDSSMYIWLGRGSTEPDPASSTLTDYISELGGGSGSTYYTTDYYPYTFDRETKIWSYRAKVFRNYWDYTAGSNAEYEIWELGMGHERTLLRTHALIYDDHGNQTCIVKRPNTRLYITAFWTASLYMGDIPRLYNEGKYVLIDPHMAMPNYGYRTMYWSLLARGVQYNNNSNILWDSVNFSWNTHNGTNVVSGDPREVHYESGPGSGNSIFWQDNFYYLSGWHIGTSSWINRYQSTVKESGYFTMFVLDMLPEPEEMETYYAYTNSAFNSICASPTSYTGDELNNTSLFRLDNLFGNGNTYRIEASNPQNWSTPSGILPCTDFHITELNFYNYLTKEWDIQIPFIDYPNRIYSYQWEYYYMPLWVKYKGTEQYVYVFVNMFWHDANGTPIPRITGFSNSSMVLAATDEYWDPSTYEEIPNLNSVPSHLQQKRYYIIVSGTIARLNPQMPSSDWNWHSINPTANPFELTHNTTGIIPRMLNHDTYSSFSPTPFINYQAYTCEVCEQYTLGSLPLISNEKGFFCIGHMLVFCDDQWNTTVYNLLIEDKYPGCKHRRYMTRNGDKLVWFSTRNCTNLENGITGSAVTRSYAIAANNFSVWTIVDKDTPPTREDIVLEWTDASVVNNDTCWHCYSWSDLGYLVVAKRRTENEFIWVDIYGENGPEQHLVTGVRHARAIKNTSYCVYQNMGLTDGSSYVFEIFDMSSETVSDTITINDGTTYTIRGIYGYNTHVYIRVSSSDNTEYIYYYNTDSHSLERLATDYSFMYSAYPYWCYQTVTYDDYMILTYQHDDVGGTYIFNGNEIHSLFNTTNINGVARCQKCFPCINTINDGKQLIFTASARDVSNSDVVVDLGLLLDSSSKQIEHVPYSYYAASDSSNYRDITGPCFPYNNGIIRMVSPKWSKNYSGSKLGRMWWFPLEMCLPMHMKGTTRTLNSYNAPVRWYMDRKLKWNITNDLSRLIPENNNGG